MNLEKRLCRLLGFFSRRFLSANREWYKIEPGQYLLIDEDLHDTNQYSSHKIYVYSILIPTDNLTGKISTILIYCHCIGKTNKMRYTCKYPHSSASYFRNS